MNTQAFSPRNTNLVLAKTLAKFGSSQCPCHDWPRRALCFSAKQPEISISELQVSLPPIPQLAATLRNSSGTLGCPDVESPAIANSTLDNKRSLCRGRSDSLPAGVLRYLLHHPSNRTDKHTWGWNKLRKAAWVTSANVTNRGTV